MRSLLSFILCFWSLTAFAGANRQLEAVTILNGAAVLTLPTSTDTIVGKESTDVLQNKTISGASNSFAAIPVGAIGDGSVLSGDNSGDVTIGASSGGLTLSGQELSLPFASASVAGALSSANFSLFNAKLTSPMTTKGDLIVFSTEHDRLPVGTDDYVLTSDSSASAGVAWKVIPVSAPSASGTTGSPNLISAGGIGFSGSNYVNYNIIASTGGAVDVTANPQIVAASSLGQELTLIGQSASDTVKLEDGNGLALNGIWISGLNNILYLVWNGSLWVEKSRQ